MLDEQIMCDYECIRQVNLKLEQNHWGVEANIHWYILFSMYDF